MFGELEAVQAGVPVPVRGAKQRALLALLALQRGKPVSSDRLIDHWRAVSIGRLRVDAHGTMLPPSHLSARAE